MTESNGADYRKGENVMNETRLDAKKQALDQKWMVTTSVHPFSLILGLVLMITALGLGVAMQQPPAPKPSTVQADEFSAARAWPLLERLLGDGVPHPVGTEANARVRDRIMGELTTLGYTVETQSTFACRTARAICGYVDNIVTRLPGRTTGPAVLLTAHYDSVGAGPGAADDMASVAIILEIARMLRMEGPLRNPVIFLLSDGEEPLLLGAEAFVAEHPWAAEVGVVINLEARGTRGQSHLFETSADDAWLIAAYAAAAPRPMASSVWGDFVPGNTDLNVYKEAGVAGVNFAFSEEVAHYHTPLDNLSHLDPGSLQHQGDNVLAMTRALAGMDLADLPAGDSVYMNLLPGLVLRLPAEWTIWFALASFLLWFGLGVVMIRRGELSVPAPLWGLLAMGLVLMGAVLFGLAATVAISYLSGVYEPWHAYPLPSLVAIWAGALLGLALSATMLARPAGFWGLSLGVWLGWSVFFVLTAWSLPGASVLFLVPTMIATLLLTGVGFTRLRFLPWAPELASVGAAFAASYVWLPTVWPMLVFEGDGGRFLGAFVGLGMGLGISALASLFALRQTSGQLRRWLVASPAVIMLAAVVVAVLVPPYSELRPQRLNLLHFEDRSLGEAYWLIDNDWWPNADLKVPQALRQAGGFGDERVAVLPWSSSPYPVAMATPASVPGPKVEVLADDQMGRERVVQLQLRSPRRGDWLALHIPQAAKLKRLEVMGTSYILAPDISKEGYQTFECYSPACDGLKVALHLESNDSFEVFVVDYASGLPPAGARLIQARPKNAVPSGEGDVSLMADRVLIGAERTPTTGTRRPASLPIAGWSPDASWDIERDTQKWK
jgi:hypothetical protein